MPSPRPAAPAPPARANPQRLNGSTIFVLAIVKLVALLAVVVALGHVHGEHDTAVMGFEHGMLVTHRVATLEAHLQAAISERRGYVISRLEASQAKAAAHIRDVQDDLATLRDLTRDDPVQKAQLDALATLLAQRIGSLIETTDRIMADPAAMPAPPDVVAQSIALGDRIDTALRQVTLREQQELAARRAELARTEWLIRIGLALCAALVAIGGLLTLTLLFGRRREAHHLEELDALNATLESRIAERTRALAISEARQRAYFEHSPIAILIARRDADGRILHEDVNPVFSALFARPAAELVGRALADVWSPADVQGLTASITTCLASLRAIHLANQRTVLDRTRTLDISLAPVLGPAGARDLVVVCLRDVTEERNQAAQLLAQAEAQSMLREREAAFFENSSDVLTVIAVAYENGQPVFRYEALSPSFETVTGLRAADLIGQQPETCLAPAILARALPRYHHCLAQSGPTRFTDTYPLPAGSKDVEGVITPIHDPATGATTRLIVLMRDVTEHNVMLAQRQQGQKLEAIGRIAAGVAHDFNNILQAMLGSLSLILDDAPEGSETQEFALLAQQAGERGAYLTHHLLAYARKEMLRSAPIAALPFLTELRDVLARVLRPNIEVMLDLDPSTADIFADRTQLHTALLNLAVNADHAMPQGGRLHLELFTDPADASGRIVIAVTDTGIGMDEETLAQAIEPFFSTKGLKGCGLGLSMVHGFAAQSGGELHIVSKPGAGTRVELRLPAAPAAPAAAPIERVARGPMSGRILLVDDADDVLVTTNAFLTRAGFQVVQAATGDAALTMLASGEAFDAMVCDFAMPGINGLDLIHEARHVQPDLPAIVITGYAGVHANAALPADTPVLQKPVRRTLLIDTLHQVMHPAGERRGNGAGITKIALDTIGRSKLN